MDEQRRNSVIAKAYALMERREELLNEPRPTSPTGSRPRQAERPLPEPSNVSRGTHLPDSMITRRLDAHIAQWERDRAGIRECLNALADEAGAECGRLHKQINEQQKQIAELQAQLNETRGELTLIRALQPKRLLSRKSATQIEGSRSDRPSVN
jgi:hypothetical protein